MYTLPWQLNEIPLYPWEICYVNYNSTYCVCGVLLLLGVRCMVSGKVLPWACLSITLQENKSAPMYIVDTTTIKSHSKQSNYFKMLVLLSTECEMITEMQKEVSSLGAPLEAVLVPLQYHPSSNSTWHPQTWLWIPATVHCVCDAVSIFFLL